VRKRARSYVFLDFTDRELEVIQFSMGGMRVAEIASCMGSTYRAIESVFTRLYPKAGVHSVAELKEWALENCLDGPTPPDTSETAQVPAPPKKRRGRIRLGRLQRAMGVKRIAGGKRGRPRLTQFDLDRRSDARERR
jgi:DNA-binding CsgD family transcriptional regulator